MAVESINLTWLDLPPKGESRKKKKKDTTGLWFFFFRIGFCSTTRTSDFPLRLYIPMPESAPHSALALYKPTKATLPLPIATAVQGGKRELRNGRRLRSWRPGRASYCTRGRGNFGNRKSAVY